MPKFSPSWFAADQVFRRHGGWYVGSERGISVGPYLDVGGAQAASMEIRTRLTRARSRGDMLRIIRGFVAAGSRSPRGEVVRAGEQPRFWFRSDRYFAVDGAWYIATREQIDVGPYGSRREAERHGSRLFALLESHHADEARRLAIQEFKARTAGH